MDGDEGELIARLIAGDEASFRTVVARHGGAMKRLARAIVGDALADEVVQEAWLKALNGLAGFAGRSSLKLWLLRIVRNHAVSRLREEVRSVASGDAAEVEAAGWFLLDGHWRVPPGAWAADTPESLLAAKELASALAAALAALPAQQRAVLTLRDLEGLDMTAICNVLDLTASNARVLLHRARRSLWLAVERHEGRR